MKALLGILGVCAAAVVALASTYTIDEREQAILTQFGKPIGDPIKEPGLHFKLPFVQRVNRFDKRWLEWDGEVDEMRTSEKTPILVDSYARWRIVDPLTYFLRMRNEETAQSRLDDVIESETRNVLASNALIEVVRATNRELPLGTDVSLPIDGAAPEGRKPGTHKVVTQVTIGREKLTRMVLERVQKTVPEYGIEVVDLRLQRVNYTPSVEQKVFERMISERKRIASRYRSEGQGESARILGRLTEDLKRIESEAYRQVQEIEGGADARATAIYARAHNLDPELYRMLKSLESYQAAVDTDTTMVLSTDSDFFRALKSIR